jgi:hypothetical protein
MYLWRVFLVRPFAAMSVLICLATILSCWSVLKKRAHHTIDRFLIGFLGLLSIYEGLRVLEACGLLALPASAHLNDMIELVVTAFYLMAILILRLSSDDRLTTNLQLRLAQAAPPKAESVGDSEREERTAHQLAWALPKLSDGAFKLYVYLWLRADHTSGRVSVDTEKLRSACGKSQAGLADCFGELEDIGAHVKLLPGNAAEVEISSPSLPDSLTMLAGN